MQLTFNVARRKLIVVGVFIKITFIEKTLKFLLHRQKKAVQLIRVSKFTFGCYLTYIFCKSVYIPIDHVFLVKKQIYHSF